MSALPVSQIVAAAKAGGFTGDRTLEVAVAIALAESGGDPSAVNRSNLNGSVDYGLWQINSVHDALLRGGSWSNPTDNARMAFAVYSQAGNKFTPWSVYKSGRYLAFLSVARGAVSGSGSTPPSGETPGVVQSGLPLPNPLSAASAFADFAKLVTDPNTWIRAGLLIAGLGLLYFGIKSTTTLDETFKSVKRQVGMAALTRGASAAGGKAASVAKVAG